MTNGEVEDVSKGRDHYLFQRKGRQRQVLAIFFEIF